MLYNRSLLMKVVIVKGNEVVWGEMPNESCEKAVKFSVVYVILSIVYW